MMSAKAVAVAVPGDEVERLPDDPGFDLGVLDQILTFRLRQVRNRLAERFRGGTWRDGLKHGEFTVLALAVANPGVYQNDLARFSGFDKTTIVAILDDLEQRRWAKRERDPNDRRRHRVSATPLGVRELDGLLDHALENERGATAMLSPAEAETFKHLLNKIYRGLEQVDGTGQAASSGGRP